MTALAVTTPDWLTTAARPEHAYALSRTQQGIWYAGQLAQSQNQFVISHYLRLPADIDLTCLRRAIEQVIRQSVVLHAQFFAVDGLPWQTFPQPEALAQKPVVLEQFDLLEHADSWERAQHLMQQDSQSELSPGKDGVAYRQVMLLVRDQQGQPCWLWYQRFHHIVLDGYSFHVLTQRILQRYQDLLAANSKPAAVDEPVPDDEFEQVLVEQAAYLHSPQYARDRAYWLDVVPDLQSAQGLLHLAPELLAASQQSSAQVLQFSCAVAYAGLKSAAQMATQQPAAAQVYPADLMMALCAAYLAALAGQTQISLGVPMMRRLGSVAANSLLPVVSVLPLHCQLRPQATLINLAITLRQQIKTLRQHQQFDAELIQRERQLMDADSANQSLYSAVINYKMFDETLHLADAQSRAQAIATGPVEHLEISFSFSGTALQLELRAPTQLFSASSLAHHAQALLALAKAAPELSQIGLAQWRMGAPHIVSSNTVSPNTENQPETSEMRSDIANAEQSLSQLVYRQASLQPAAIALHYEGQQLSYLQLAQQSSQLAHYLQTQGAQAGCVIGLAMPRSEQALLAILAILHTGASLLPLDLDYPAERLALMCDDAQPLFILSETAQSHKLPQGLRVCYRDLPEVAAAIQQSPLDSWADAQGPAILPDQPAYIIFTSGSTGRPKGVMNTHGALLNLFKAHAPVIYQPAIQRLQLSLPAQGKAARRLRAAHTHSFSFDSSWLQLFWLAHGQEVVLFDEESRRDAEALVMAIRELQIDSLDLPPSFLAQMMNCGLFANAEHHPSLILIGGEAAPASLWQQLAAQADLQAYNLYGPTEYTVDTLRADIKAHPAPVLGQAIAHTSVYVLDAFLRPVMPGVAGELYISGAGLAHAYLARAGLSASRFVANPYYREGDASAANRMYRTGDLVRRNLAGELEFLGRTDDQIKIRGYRVELAEVENALASLPDVESAIVLAESLHNSQRLLAFVVVPELIPALAEHKASEYLAELRQHLPEYMVPARLFVFASFPRNVSGKIDRRVLLEYSQQAHQVTQARGDERALSPAEACLLDCVATVLRPGRVQLDADFFALGGDSISAIVICTQLRAAGYLLKPRAVFAGRSLATIAAAIQALPAAASAISATAQSDLIAQAAAETQARLLSLRKDVPELADMAPLLPLQAGMVFHAELSGSGRHYNSHTRLQLSGAIEAALWQAALDALLQEFPQLAARLLRDAQQASALLIPDTQQFAMHWPMQFVDLSQEPVVNMGAAIAQAEHALLAQEPDFESWTGLIQAVLLKTGTQQGVLLIMVHHMLTDGWSSALLFNALCRHYQTLARARCLAASPPAVVQASGNYASLVRQLLARPQQPAREYWRDYLQASENCLLFPVQATTVQPAAVAEFSLRLHADLCERLQTQLRQQGVTLNILMQAIWALVLSMYTGRRDVLFGAPVAGRDVAIDGIAAQPGLFLSTLPVRVQLDPQRNLWQQLGELQQQHLLSMEHDNLSLAEILRENQLAEGFDTLLVVENYPDHAYVGKTLGQGEFALSITEVHNRGYSHYPLALLVLPGERFELLLESRVAGFAGAALLQRIEFLLLQAVTRADQALFSWDWCLPHEMTWLADLQATGHTLRARHLPELLQQQADATPAASALSDAKNALNYHELQQQVLCLAQRLHALGLQRGDVVAIALPRSVLLTIAIHAVVAVGAVYLPLDSSHPDSRLAYMLGNASVRVLITQSGDLSRSQNWQPAGSHYQTLVFDDLFADAELLQAQIFASELSAIQGQLRASDGAYLIYTSGTTGQPKGALVSHAAIVNRLCWMQAEYRLQVGDVVLQKTPCGFDVSVWEFFWPLISGARLHMAEPDAHKDPAALLALIQQQKVTCLHFVPSMLAMFCQYLQELTAEQRNLTWLRLVFCSGEALASNLAREFIQYSDAGLHNLYGPTEAAVDVSYADVRQRLAAECEAELYPSSSVSIGKAVWNTQLHVLDPYLRPLPVGAIGELYLAGIQLADGYLGRAELTAARFVANPWQAGQRMYRTGDLVRYLADGSIDYLGRGDDQLKLRGMRIELAEIEAVLLQYPGITQVAVQAMVLQSAQPQSQQQADQRQLVAYLVQREELDLAGLRQFLQQHLPAHMLPVAYLNLPALPLSANGKLDRRALPAPEIMPEAGDSTFSRAPAAGLEAKLAGLFCKILGLREVGAEQSFFDLGGHSLLAMRLAAEIRRECQRQISVGQIILHPSVAQLAARLNQTVMLNDFGEQGYQSSLRLKEGKFPALFCFYPGSGFAWQYSVLGAYLQTGQALIGLQSPRPDGLIAQSASMAELVDAQLAQIRQLQAQGPYYLLGYSLGGSVAYAVAARLREEGETVAWLGLLDTYPAEVHSWDQQQAEGATRGAEQEQARLIHDALRADGELDADLRLEKEKMLSQIFANYQDAVRLLSASSTPAYDQPFTVFVAQASLPDYIDPESAWSKYASQANFHYLATCSHEDILSPANLQKLGPVINHLLDQAQQAARENPQQL